MTSIQDEREFLLRSIEDLDRERAEGNLGEAEHQRLRDDYTARAAAALRAPAAGDGGSPAPSAGPLRRVAVIAGVAVFVVASAVLLTRSLGERLPGESATGNDQQRSEFDRLMDEAGRLAADGEVADALRRYDEAARLDSGAAEPRASAAFIVFQAGLVDEALERLDEAEAADPSYAETWFVRGVVLYQGRGDAEGARDAFNRYLEQDPDGPFAENARVFLQEIDRSPTEPSEDPNEQESP